MDINNRAQYVKELTSASLNLENEKKSLVLKETALEDNRTNNSPIFKLKNVMTGVSAKDKLQWEVDYAKIQVNFKKMEVSFAKIRLILVDINQVIREDSNTDEETTSSAEESGSDEKASKESEKDSTKSEKLKNTSDFKNKISQKVQECDDLLNLAQTSFQNYSKAATNIKNKVTEIEEINISKLTQKNQNSIKNNLILIKNNLNSYSNLNEDPEDSDSIVSGSSNEGSGKISGGSSSTSSSEDESENSTRG